MDTPRLVAVGLLVSGNRVLLQRRPITGTLPGLWEFPGGKVEFGEHPWESLEREVREELSIEIPKGSLFGLYSHVYDFSGTEAHYVLAAYRVHLERGKVPPTEDRRWVPIRDLGTWAIVPGSKAIVADLQRKGDR